MPTFLLRCLSTPTSPTPTSNGDKKIKGIECLLKECRDPRKRYADDVLLYFREERCNSWALRPSVMRRFSFREKESGMLNELMSRQPEAFSGLTSAFSQWVLAQHYRLNTRLLNVARNPLVTLFNACEEGGDKDGRLHVFAVPRDLDFIRPFNSDAICQIAICRTDVPSSSTEPGGTIF